MEVYQKLDEAINQKGEFIRDPKSNYPRENTPLPPAVRSSPEAIKARELGREAHIRQREEEKNKTPEQKEAERQERMRKARAVLNPQKEQVDIYDIILSHLLDEGYADDLESAENIMVSMSEEWGESIVEAINQKGEFIRDNPPSAPSPASKPSKSSPAVKPSKQSKQSKQSKPASTSLEVDAAAERRRELAKTLLR
jgi:hypothetical protein